jgi:hypothetical protein
MTAAVIALALLNLALLIAWARMNEQWGIERQNLLERIQRPERIPVEPDTKILAPLETDSPELAKVGALFPEDEE